MRIAKKFRKILVFGATREPLRALGGTSGTVLGRKKTAVQLEKRNWRVPCSGMELKNNRPELKKNTLVF